MKLTKSMKYYFIFNLVWIPLSFILNLVLEGNIPSFFTLIGIGALGLLVFLVIRYLVLKEKRVNSIVNNLEDTSRSVTPIETNAFTLMFNKEGSVEE